MSALGIDLYIYRSLFDRYGCGTRCIEVFIVLEKALGNCFLDE